MDLDSMVNDLLDIVNEYEFPDKFPEDVSGSYLENFVHFSERSELSKEETTLGK
jgi:hypothetical protein